MDPSRPTTIPPHEIVVIQTPEERQQCYDVRINVFHTEQKFPLETEIDEFEELATHFLLRLIPSKTPIGTIRVYKAPGGGYYKLSRLAVLKDYRSYRFGRELVLALHDWVRTDALKASQSVAEIVSHSQLYIKGFYAKFGYEAEGAEFDEDGDPHQKMVLRLPL
ncbi:acyl-CoA N-acyltransferase [Collybia nuda]|uniref:Acyl-CoA N-acyltransferase n=1 Tax=Collybia nuda TaxID=64659 RepID=A0A9P6CK04_9AGAR|nr:acyl-CoA N-acyltransferase [Collybia nuda]